MCPKDTADRSNVCRVAAPQSLLSLLLASFLTACSGVSGGTKGVTHQKRPLELPPLLDASAFGAPQKIIPVRAVFSLTAAQEDHFLAMFNAPENQDIPPHKRIYRYLEGHLTDFQYYFDTLVASQALTENRGNCLSLAILTKAIADLTNIEVAYQLVETEPVYQMRGNIVVSSQHVRTVLFAPKSSLNAGHTLFRGRIVVDYFPTFNTRVLRRVDENEFRSMFYLNRAASALVRGDNNTAYWHTKEALDLTPNYDRAINMLALLHVRAGYPDYAERLYLFGLDRAKEKLELLNNYHTLLVNLGRADDAEAIRERIGRRNDGNPYRWIGLGNTAYNSREFSKAISYYRRAIRLAPYLHEPYAGIARCQFQLGYHRSAHKSIRQALTNVERHDIRELYQAKLEMLSKLLGIDTPVVSRSQ